MVSGQIDGGGGFSEFGSPPVKKFFEALSRDSLLLPPGIIAILKRKLRKVRFAAF
jgi:hypothetical protein